jgi:hypothetical protein
MSENVCWKCGGRGSLYLDDDMQDCDLCSGTGEFPLPGLVAVDGVVFYNATPHCITLQAKDGSLHTISAGIPVNARPVEIAAGTGPGDIEFVRTEFRGAEDGRRVIDLAQAAGAQVIIGSIIAAQAYPGLVVAMVPAPGFERVAPAEKRMRADKFTTFAPVVPTTIFFRYDNGSGYMEFGDKATPDADVKVWHQEQVAWSEKADLAEVTSDGRVVRVLAESIRVW